MSRKAFPQGSHVISSFLRPQVLAPSIVYGHWSAVLYSCRLTPESSTRNGDGEGIFTHEAHCCCEKSFGTKPGFRVAACSFVSPLRFVGRMESLVGGRAVFEDGARVLSDEPNSDRTAAR